MGLFKSIFKIGEKALWAPLKPFKGVFKGIGKALKGTPDKVNWVPPNKLIAPPSEQEKQLLDKLFPYATGSLDKARTIGDLAWGDGGFIKNALGQHNRLYNQTLNVLNSISKGELPDTYKTAVNRVFNEQLGGILNNLSNRGVINSSVSQRAISNALNKAMDMQVNYLPVAAKMATMPYDFGVSKPLGIFSTLRDIEKDYVSYPSNLWNTLMTARHGVRAMPIVQKGKPGLLGALGMLGGAGVGAYFGGPTGAMIGSQVGGYLGNTASYYL